MWMTICWPPGLLLIRAQISGRQIKELDSSQLHRHEFHSNWSYTLRPTTRPKTTHLNITRALSAANAQHHEPRPRVQSRRLRGAAPARLQGRPRSRDGSTNARRSTHRAVPEFSIDHTSVWSASYEAVRMLRQRTCRPGPWTNLDA